jgi:hypothetical protein
MRAIRLPSASPPAAPSPAPAGDGSPRAGAGHGHDETPAFRIEPLRGWHLPLLDDPAFLPLQPMLQRSLLLALPERLLTVFSPQRPMAARVLVALRDDPAGPPRVLGLIAGQRLNRTGSCWQVDHLQLARREFEPSRHTIAAALLRESIHRVTGAASWIAAVDSGDLARLAVLREQGFQPLRTDRLWRWPGEKGGRPEPAPPPVPSDLQLRPLNRRNASLLWHLEQATYPAHLRQLLDRRIEDLVDQSHGHGWMLVDPSRRVAVAGIRRVRDHGEGGLVAELSLDPGWTHLLGPATELLLRRLAERSNTLWLRSEVGDTDRERWLGRLGAQPQGEQVLMARSVWRRQEWHPARGPVGQLAAVLEQFQPRRRPVPSPLDPRAAAIRGEGR